MNGGTSNLYQDFLFAVNSLFHSNDKNLQRQANQFICDFDKRPESWDISYQILSSDNLSDEVYFNAIQILKNKIKFDFGNYSENREMIIKLVSFLLDKIDKFKQLKHYILLNYCHCFSMAMLFSGSDFTILMKKCVEKLNSQNNINDTLALLLIFNYLIEVDFDNSIVIDDDKRDEFNFNLSNIANEVIQFLNNLIKYIKKGEIKDGSLLKVLNTDILETFTNWLKLGLNENTIEKLNNEYIDIINFVFEINDSNIQKHTDCICYLLELPLDNQEMENLAKIIFSKILPFKEVFYKNISSLDPEQCSFYIEVFSSLITNNLQEILSENRLDLVQLMVDLSKICPSSRIDLICDFFSYLDSFLYERQVSKENILAQFKGYYIQLIKNLVELIKFPSDIFKTLNEAKTKVLKHDDEYNNIKDYRYVIKQFLLNFTKDYSFNFIFNEILFPEFIKTVEKIKNNSNNLNYWSKFEAILYAFSSISELVKESELKSLNVIFNTILDVPKNFFQITRTVTDIIDHLENVLNKNETLLNIFFQYLIEGLSNELTLKYCSISSKNLLSKNKEIFSKNKNVLIDLYNNKIKNNVLAHTKYLPILEGIVEVICYNNNGNGQEIGNYLIDIFKQWVLFLIEAKNKSMLQNVQFSSEEMEKLIELLIVLKSISKSAFDGLSKENFIIMEKIFNEIWPHLKILFNKFSTNNDLVEEIIQLIKFYMRGFKDNFKLYIPEYLNCLIEGYKLSPISSYLYGFEILITVFGNYEEENIKNMINVMFNQLCQITFNNYIRNRNDLLINVQLGEDFFGLMYRILKISPIFLIDSEMLDNIISISLENLSIDQIQISKNIIIFINNLINCPYKTFLNEMKKKNQDKYVIYYNKIQKKIEGFISSLIKEILHILLLVPPNVIYENISELIMNLVKKQQNLCVKYFSEHLKEFPGDVLTNKEKDNFIMLIQNISIQEKKFEDYLEVILKRCQNKQIRDNGKMNNKI